MNGETTAIRVLLGCPLPAIHDWKSDLARQMEVQIVGTVEGALDLLMAARETAPNVVALPSETGDFPGLTSHLLFEYPDLTVLTFFPSGEVIVVQRRPVSLHLENLSFREMLEVVRSVVDDPGCWLGEE